MALMAAMLSDDQSISDLVAYINTVDEGTTERRRAMAMERRF
jgi:hypothetical protein